MNRNININTYELDNLLFKEQTMCLLDDDFLTYSTDNDKVRINLNNFSLTKENNETIFKLSLNKATLFVKSINNSLDLPIDYINYQNEDNKNIIIEYKLASQENILKIEITIGEIIDEI